MPARGCAARRFCSCSSFRCRPLLWRPPRPPGGAGARGGGGFNGVRVLLGDGGRSRGRGGREEGGGGRPAVLAVFPAAENPTPSLLERLAHEYGLKDELDERWAVRPLALVRDQGRT